MCSNSMYPVYIHGKLARNSSILEWEKEYESFEKECFLKLEEIYTDSEYYSKAKERLLWELDKINIYNEVTIFRLAQITQKALGQGYFSRGLAASLVSFLLGLTHVDPIRENMDVKPAMGTQGNKICYL